ncbi:MAG: MFS transporter [Planctomycetota bacterium]
MSQDIALERSPSLPSTQTVGLAFVAVMAAHAMVDALSALVPASLGLLEARLQLGAQQTAWLMGVGPLFSGVIQPVCALVSDRYAIRSPVVLGVVLGVVGIGALGLASTFWTLAAAYAVGMIGIGMFHPVGVATAGHLWSERRSTAVSYFFVIGMVGGVLGAFAWPRILAQPNGFQILPMLVAPILLLALLLNRSFAALKPLHAHHATDAPTDELPVAEWAMVGVLYVASVLRFCVNMSLVYLFVRWTQSYVAALHADWSLEQVAKGAAPMVGSLNAATLVGMAVGGTASGLFVRTGKEKWPMVLVPLLFSPVIALFPFVPIQAGYVLAVAAGIGFASMIPVTIALAQRLLPRRTNLASSLMMGGAWAVALLGPACAEYGVAQLGLQNTFLLTAATLAISGLVCLVVEDRP